VAEADHGAGVRASQWEGQAFEATAPQNDESARRCTPIFVNIRCEPRRRAGEPPWAKSQSLP